jgi:hypothetical protein
VYFSQTAIRRILQEGEQEVCLPLPRHFVHAQIWEDEDHVKQRKGIPEKWKIGITGREGWEQGFLSEIRALLEASRCPVHCYWGWVTGRDVSGGMGHFFKAAWSWLKSSTIWWMGDKQITSIQISTSIIRSSPIHIAPERMHLPWEMES